MSTELTSTLEEQLSALSHPECRRLMFTLLARGTGQNNDAVITDGGPAGNDRTKEIRLHHNYLPRLATHEFIDWNRETNEITRGDKFEEIRPLLRLLYENRDQLPDDVS